MSPARPFWLQSAPLLLASRSQVRQDMLSAAGIPVEAVPADIDERALEARISGDAGTVAQALARAKAEAVSARYPGRLVLGADQVLALDDEKLAKPGCRDTARVQLQRLSGRAHELVSGYALLNGGRFVAEGVAVARLTMRGISGDYLDRYLDLAGDTVRDSVGGYRLEDLGAQLFESVEGDYFTVLGLPLLKVLADLRRLGVLLS